MYLPFHRTACLENVLLDRQRYGAHTNCLLHECVPLVLLDLRFIKSQQFWIPMQRTEHRSSALKLERTTFLGCRVETEGGPVRCYPGLHCQQLATVSITGCFRRIFEPDHLRVLIGLIKRCKLHEQAGSDHPRKKKGYSRDGGAHLTLSRTVRSRCGSRIEISGGIIFIHRPTEVYALNIF